MLQAAAVRILFWTIRLLPVRLAGAIGAGLGRMVFYLDAKHREIAQRNLVRVHPQRSRRWRRRMARESFAELGRTIFELPHVFLRSEAFLRSRVQVEGEEALRVALQEGQGAFITACHHGNWELGALMFSLLGFDPNFLYRPLRQAPLDAYLKQCRERFGAIMHSRTDGMRWMPQVLKRGGCVSFMIDQHLSDGVPVPFLGHLANTTVLPATVIYRYSTPVFGVALQRLGKGFRFRLRLWSIPVPAASLSGDKALDAYHLMRQINRSFAPVIAEDSAWLWVHRRWWVLEEERGVREAVYGTP